ncbi:Rnase H [Caulobacter phage CcrColossus]|uniref:Uncharacterized protein n=1 Tax=Caulobacter phage CcrColossus TaxID=1211640 RepID=K4JVS0_9CAUD|nr:Rnase H [Caulobacter phage CcrColossus]AFU87948.1 hypothetical protein CcrColossus_gp078 [Caulobacter phage CcrColossus]
MRYFLDTEFNGFGGCILSLALVAQNGASLYLVWPTNDMPEDPDPWVLQNVIPLMDKVPDNVRTIEVRRGTDDAARHIAEFLRGDPAPEIVTDWPDDIRYFCETVITGPGQMIAIPRLAFQMLRVDAYPTTLAGAVQHNAFWDAWALHTLLTPNGVR